MNNAHRLKMRTDLKRKKKFSHFHNNALIYKCTLQSNLVNNNTYYYCIGLVYMPRL